MHDMLILMQPPVGSVQIGEQVIPVGVLDHSIYSAHPFPFRSVPYRVPYYGHSPLQRPY